MLVLISLKFMNTKDNKKTESSMGIKLGELQMEKQKDFVLMLSFKVAGAELMQKCH